MATLDAVPDPNGVTLKCGAEAGSNIAPPVVKQFVPTNPDGTVYDCTALTAVPNCYIAFPGFDLNKNDNTHILTVALTNTAHDATGFTVTFSEANIQAIQTFMAGQSTCNMSIIAAEAGGDQAMVAQGTLAIDLVP